MRSKHLEEVIAQSKTPCDCIDCDGEWCVWCLEHHGRKRCPFVRAIEAEERRLSKLLDGEEG